MSEKHNDLIERTLAGIDKLSPGWRAPVTALIELVGKEGVVLSRLWPKQFPGHDEAGTIESVTYGRNWFEVTFRPNNSEWIERHFCRWD